MRTNESVCGLYVHTPASKVVLPWFIGSMASFDISWCGVVVEPQRGHRGHNYNRDFYEDMPCFLW